MMLCLVLRTLLLLRFTRLDLLVQRLICRGFANSARKQIAREGGSYPSGCTTLTMYFAALWNHLGKKKSNEGDAARPTRSTKPR